MSCRCRGLVVLLTRPGGPAPRARQWPRRAAAPRRSGASGPGSVAVAARAAVAWRGRSSIPLVDGWSRHEGATSRPVMTVRSRDRGSGHKKAPLTSGGESAGLLQERYSAVQVVVIRSSTPGGKSKMRDAIMAFLPWSSVLKRLSEGLCAPETTDGRPDRHASFTQICRSRRSTRLALPGAEVRSALRMFGGRCA